MITLLQIFVAVQCGNWCWSEILCIGDLLEGVPMSDIRLLPSSTGSDSIEEIEVLVLLSFDVCPVSEF
jgi:hypothetical protein